MARAIVFWADEATAQIIPDATAAGEFREQVNLLADPGTFMRLALLDYFIPEAGSVTKSCSTSVDTTLGATLVTFGSPNATQEDVLDSIAETMSIHVLIRPDTVAAGSRTIIRKHQAWGLQLNGATVEFLYRDGGGVDRTVTGPTVSASTVTHLVVVDDGTTIHFYKDGVETTAARAGTAGYTQNTNTVNIGAYHNGVSASNFWDGRLDELAIWNVALSDNMASSYYVAHSAGTFGTDLDSRMPRVKLEIAWASAPTDECLVWEDMTDYARNTEGLAIQRGRSAELDRAETGTMNFALSCNEREFDPNYASSPFYPNVKPTRAVRFRAQSDTDAVVWSRFFGYTQGWPQRRNQGAFDIVAVFTAADPAFALALDKVQGSMARPPEYAGDRLDAVLGDIPNLKVDLEAGQSELVAADLDGVNRLEHSQAVVESDGGILFAAGDGTMTFHDRHHRTIYESTVRATDGDGGGSELPIEHQEPAIDEGHLFTAARITDAFGRVASASDDAAALEHFVRTKDLATLQTNANEAQAMAEAFAHRYATPRERIPDLRINPTAHPTTPLTMWETALGHEIGHRIETVERVGGDGSSVSREVFIEGITDRVRARDWRISLRTSPADLEGNYWLLGTGELGDEEGITSTALGW
jgi:hypothetical protein